MLVLGFTDVSLTLKEQLRIIVLALVGEECGSCTLVYHDELWCLLDLVVVEVEP